MLAIIPFGTFFKLSHAPGKVARASDRISADVTSGELRLIKLLRVPRLFELLNVDRFKKYIKDYYNNKLKGSIRASNGKDAVNNEEPENYPILRAIMYV